MIEPFRPLIHGQKASTGMTSIVVLHGHQLGQVYQRLRIVAALQAILAVSALPFVILTPRLAAATVLLVLVLGAYAAAKGYVAVKHTRVLKQLRLEERFLRDLPRGEKLVALLARDNHLWSSSRLWIGLRALLTQPLPHLLLVDEKRKRIERHYHRAIRDLQPRRFNGYLPAVLGLVGFWHLTWILSGVSGGAFLLTAGLLSGVLALEVLQTGIQWGICHQFTLLEQALCDWTLYNRFELGVSSREKNYVHRLLYQARPWFLAPGTRRVQRSVMVDSALREVA